MEIHMNMQVANLASTTAIPVGALTAHATAEPIISLIEAYEAGAKIYSASDDESPEFVQATYGEPFDRIISGEWEIQTVAGAIAAIQFAKKEDGFFLDGHATGPLIDAVLRFLESAAGTSLVHPDAELLALHAQLEPMEREHDELWKKVGETDAEADRLRDDRTGLAFTHDDQVHFGYGIKDDGRRTIVPWLVADLKPADLATTLPQYRQRAIGRNERLAELIEAANRWRKALDGFYEASGRRALLDQVEALGDQRSLLMDAILATPAKTMAGLAVKAALTKRQNPKWWEVEKTYLNFEDECARSLVDDLVAYREAGR